MPASDLSVMPIAFHEYLDVIVLSKQCIVLPWGRTGEEVFKHVLHTTHEKDLARHKG